MYRITLLSASCCIVFRFPLAFQYFLQWNSSFNSADLEGQWYFSTHTSQLLGSRGVAGTGQLVRWLSNGW